MIGLPVAGCLLATGGAYGYINVLGGVLRHDARCCTGTGIGAKVEDCLIPLPAYLRRRDLRRAEAAQAAAHQGSIRQSPPRARPVAHSVLQANHSRLHPPVRSQATATAGAVVRPGGNRQVPQGAGSATPSAPPQDKANLRSPVHGEGNGSDRVLAGQAIHRPGSPGPKPLLPSAPPPEHVRPSQRWQWPPQYDQWSEAGEAYGARLTERRATGDTAHSGPSAPPLDLVRSRTPSDALPTYEEAVRGEQPALLTERPPYFESVLGPKPSSRSTGLVDAIPPIVTQPTAVAPEEAETLNRGNYSPPCS